MQAVIENYFSRFTSPLTESVYAMQSLCEFNEMQRYNDYLDYDQHSLIRDKASKAPCGLRNLGNTCYFNVLLQLLYGVNSFRQKIIDAETSESKLVQCLRMLFGRMCVGKLAFADPTQLFQHLKSVQPNLFIAGVQNDFHETFTLLLDELMKDFKASSAQQAKFISKLFFGKLSMKTDYGSGTINRNTRFNNVNLEVCHGSFEKALQAWTKNPIEDYITPQGEKVKAQLQNCFLETPAIMSFMINRVSYSNSQLEKNSSKFDFDETIMIPKKHAVDNKKLTLKVAEQEKALTDERICLEKWIQKVSLQKQQLKQTLKYLEEKDMPKIDAPTITNSVGEQHFQTVRTYLEEQVKAIDRTIKQINESINEIKTKIAHLLEEHSFQNYIMWAVMIHQGDSPVAGHYKLCVRVAADQWIEYNDRKVSTVGESIIQKYKDKGEISCLFYRRSSLVCSEPTGTLSYNLKTTVTQEEKAIMRQIDQSRLLQSLYQVTESASILLQYEINKGTKKPFVFFFKPVIYCIRSQYSYAACRGVVAFGLIDNEHFVANLLNKFLLQSANVTIPELKFRIPEDYYKIREAFKRFFSKESKLVTVGTAYEELSQQDLLSNQKLIRSEMQSMLEIIIMKGIFYLSIFAECEQSPARKTFDQISSSIDALFSLLNPDSEFFLVYIPIRYSIVRSSRGNLLLNFGLHRTIQSYDQYFNENFKYWIHQRADLRNMDQIKFAKCKELFGQYTIAPVPQD